VFAGFLPEVFLLLRVAYMDREAVCVYLKKIYDAENLDDAEYAKEEFRGK